MRPQVRQQCQADLHYKVRLINYVTLELGDAIHICRVHSHVGIFVGSDGPIFLWSGLRPNGKRGVIQLEYGCLTTYPALRRSNVPDQQK